MDALTSSLQSWNQGGLGATTVDSLAIEAANNESSSAFQALGSFKPSSSGVFNIPVCTTYDLASYPTPGDATGSPYAMCACGLGSAKDKYGNLFRDNVPSALFGYIGGMPHKSTGAFDVSDTPDPGCEAWNGDPGRSDLNDYNEQWSQPANTQDDPRANTPPQPTLGSEASSTSGASMPSIIS